MRQIFLHEVVHPEPIKYATFYFLSKIENCPFLTEYDQTLAIMAKIRLFLPYIFKTIGFSCNFIGNHNWHLSETKIYIHFVHFRPIFSKRRHNFFIWKKRYGVLWKNIPGNQSYYDVVNGWRVRIILLQEIVRGGSYSSVTKLSK